MTMMPFNRMRLLHWLVASLCLLAYLTGDDGELWHIWLGYGLIVALLLRILFGLLKLRGFGPLLPRPGMLAKQPQTFISRAMVGGLIIGMIGCSVTGVLMVDNAKILNLAGVSPVAAVLPAAHADDEHEFEGNKGGQNEWLEEIHEFFANGTLALAALHVAYVFAVRRRMAWSMIGRKPQIEPRGAVEPGGR